MITSYTAAAAGEMFLVTVVSDLADPIIYYHWWLDGVYVDSTTVPDHAFFVPAGDLARVECVDTADADYDPLVASVATYPARRTLFFLRSLAAVEHYRVEQRANVGAWTTIARVLPENGQWSFQVLSPRLADLTVYDWRVIPVDAAGNDGTALSLPSESPLVRVPDAPEFTATFDPNTTTVTIAAA